MKKYLFRFTGIRRLSTFQIECHYVREIHATSAKEAVAMLFFEFSKITRVHGIAITSEFSQRFRVHPN